MDIGYLEDGSAICIPDVKIVKDRPEYVYLPVRGFSASLAVLDLEDRCIGWIPIEALGYYTVREWMAAVRYIGR